MKRAVFNKSGKDFRFFKAGHSTLVKEARSHQFIFRCKVDVIHLFRSKIKEPSQALIDLFIWKIASDRNPNQT